MKRCCNTCKWQDGSYYGCSKANECYNGYSAYEVKDEKGEKHHGQEN
jgi:hypothetical protein